MRRTRIALFLGLLAAACSPGVGALPLAEASGVAVDRETGEPIRGAWVVQWVFGAAIPGAERPELSARFATTDADGRFAFAAAAIARPGFWSEGVSGPTYSLFHPSYGLVHGGDRPSRLSASLRDSALRLADLQPFCSGARSGEGAKRLARRACAPSADPLAPHARGEQNAKGYRTGVWTFHWEDGAIAARGRYDNGAAVGAWEHFDRSGRPAE